MAAITWRNIDAPSTSDASRALQYATNTIDNSFQRLNTVLADQQQANQNVLDRGRDTALATLQERVAAAVTPEQAQALQNDPQLAALREQLDPTRRLRAVGLEQKQLVDSRANALGALRYNIETQTEEQRPLEQALLVKAAQGDVAGVNAGAAANPDLRNIGTIMANAIAAQRNVKQDERLDSDEKRKAELHPIEKQIKQDTLLNTASQRNYQAALGTAALEQAAALQANRTSAQDLKVQEAQRAALEKARTEYRSNSVYSQGVYGTKEGETALMSGLKTRGLTDNQIADVMENLASEFPNGIPVQTKDGPSTIDLPVSTILDAVSQAGDWPILNRGWSFKGNNTASRLKALLVDPDSRDKNLLNEISMAHDVLKNQNIRQLEALIKGKSGAAGGAEAMPKGQSAEAKLKAAVTAFTGVPSTEAGLEDAVKKALR